MACEAQRENQGRSIEVLERERQRQHAYATNRRTPCFWRALCTELWIACVASVTSRPVRHEPRPVPDYY